MIASPSQPHDARRRPKQQRSRMLVSSIHEACLKILQSGGAHDLTARQIAEVAGVTMASFYQYFPNKEAVLVDILLERGSHETEYIAGQIHTLEKASEESLTKTIEALVNFTCDLHLRLLKRHSDIYRRYHRHLDFMTYIKASLKATVDVPTAEDGIRFLLTRYRTQIDVLSFDSAVFLITSALQETTSKAVDEKPHLLDDELFRQSLISLMLRYLNNDRPT
jgi:AcrR family transcriptional regulator